jgi:D-lactate dehydrogenase
LSTTPRQRIALRREMVRQGGATPLAEALLRDFDYDAVQTCAGDGSCELACPVGINTGVLMKRYRHVTHGATAERVAATLARRFLPVERAARLAVGAAGAAAKLVGHGTLAAITGAARNVVSKDLMPGWLPNMPRPAKAQPLATARGARRRCTSPPASTVSSATPPASSARLRSRAGRVGPAGLPVDTPTSAATAATIWHSKGYETGNALMANRPPRRSALERRGPVADRLR